MSFAMDIHKFNEMYKLPIAGIPSLAAVENPIQRLKDFKVILLNEIDEVDDIIATLEEKDPQLRAIDVLTELADWLGDIQVYCASEMAKFGIPLNSTLGIIMQSNFSKLGADGKPIYDERGKVQKGPGYWKPEPRLKEMLQNEYFEYTRA